MSCGRTTGSTTTTTSERVKQQQQQHRAEAIPSNTSGNQTSPISVQGAKSQRTRPNQIMASAATATIDGSCCCSTSAPAPKLSWWNKRLAVEGGGGATGQPGKLVNNNNNNSTSNSNKKAKGSIIAHASSSFVDKLTYMIKKSNTLTRSESDFGRGIAVCEPVVVKAAQLNQSASARREQREQEQRDSRAAGDNAGTGTGTGGSSSSGKNNSTSSGSNRYLISELSWRLVRRKAVQFASNRIGGSGSGGSGSSGAQCAVSAAAAAAASAGGATGVARSAMAAPPSPPSGRSRAGATATATAAAAAGQQHQQQTQKQQQERAMLVSGVGGSSSSLPVPLPRLSTSLSLSPSINNNHDVTATRSPVSRDPRATGATSSPRSSSSSMATSSSSMGASCSVAAMVHHQQQQQQPTKPPPPPPQQQQQPPAPTSSAASSSVGRKSSGKEKKRRQKEAEKVEKLRLLVSYLKSGTSQPMLRPVELEAEELELAQRYKQHLILCEDCLQAAEHQQEAAGGMAGDECVGGGGHASAPLRLVASSASIRGSARTPDTMPPWPHPFGHSHHHHHHHHHASTASSTNDHHNSNNNNISNNSHHQSTPPASSGQLNTTVAGIVINVRSSSADQTTMLRHSVSDPGNTSSGSACNNTNNFEGPLHSHDDQFLAVGCPAADGTGSSYSSSSGVGGISSGGIGIGQSSTGNRLPPSRSGSKNSNQSPKLFYIDDMERKDSDSSDTNSQLAASGSMRLNYGQHHLHHYHQHHQQRQLGSESACHQSRSKATLSSSDAISRDLPTRSWSSELFLSSTPTTTTTISTANTSCAPLSSTLNTRSNLPSTITTSDNNNDTNNNFANNNNNQTSASRSSPATPAVSKTSAWTNPQNLATWIDNEVNSLVNDLEAKSQLVNEKHVKSSKRKWLSSSSRRNSSGAHST